MTINNDMNDVSGQEPENQKHESWNRADLLKTVSVLYVEDDTDTRELLTQILERRVGKLYVAMNGQEGLDAWHRYKPEVVVTDIMMPVMDGLKMAEIIRQESASVPIILTTAFNELGFLLKAIDLSIDKYVAKPINTELLLQAIGKGAWSVKVGLEMQLAATVFDASSDAILITDSENRIINVNAAFTEITGYSKSEVLRQTPMILSSGRHDAEHHHALWENLKQTGQWSGEAWSRRKNGDIYAEWMTINTVKDSRGVITHHVAIFSDITKHKQREEELEQHRNHLQEMVDERTAEALHAKEVAEIASHAKSEFLATMSHEIRTPMNGVVGMVDILQETPLSAEQRRMVRIIRESSVALLSILNDIMDFSKIEAGKLTIEAIPTHVREVSEGVAELLAPVAASTNIDFYVFVSPDTTAWILSDRLRLQQILFNLLGNAIKFTQVEDTDRHNKVMLRVENAVLASGHPGLRLRITDNGIGMLPETLPQLFQPFTQADNSTTRRFGGTGLGLSITKQLVEMLEGQIYVQSTPQVGSEFTVELPLWESSPGRVLLAEPNLAGVRVLAVTTDQAYAEILPAYLRHAGAQVEVVADISGAHRQMLESENGTVLLLDHSHPGILPTQSEFELMDRVRAVQLIRRSGLNVYHKAVTVMTCPLLYHDLISGVAIAAELLSVQDSVKKSDQRKQLRRIAPTVNEAEQAGQLILLAEDNETNREVIQEQLRLLGYASESAADGVEAMDKWRSGRYALLLTDYHMPNMDGCQLAAAIREEESRKSHQAGHDTPHFPIIAVTANAMQGEEKRCLELGMDDYLPKPLRLDKLGSLLAKWLPLPVQQAGSISGVPSASSYSADDRTRSAAPAAYAVWDDTVLVQMVGNNPGMHRRLRDKFFSNSEKQLTEINAAVMAGHANMVMETAHKLKSAARTVGAMRLGALCQDMETAAQMADMQAIQTLNAEMKAAFLEVVEWIKGNDPAI